VLIAHGLFDLRTPYAGTVRLLDMLPDMDGAAPVVLRVYPGGHMFYFNDAPRAALHDEVEAMFDEGRVTANEATPTGTTPSRTTYEAEKPIEAPTGPTTGAATGTAGGW
jgi:hypothetical protein